MNQFDAVSDEYNHAVDSVQLTDEFRRVFALPRAPDWTTREDLEDLVDLMTAAYKTPEGTMRLFPSQAVTLESMVDTGVHATIGVGEGKTLVSFLAGVVAEATRTAILVPAKLEKKTYRDFEVLAKHWQAPEDFRVFRYEMLGRVQGAELLNEYRPDLIVADEAHKLKNNRAAVTRRVVRYFMENPNTLFLPMSGTSMNHSIMELHHIFAMCFGMEGMPLPAIATEARRWARAVDRKSRNRCAPGAFRMYVNGRPTIDKVRQVVGERIHQTPGMIRTTTQSVSASILVDFVDLEPSTDIRKAVRRLVRDKVGPDDEECLPSDVYRHMRTLSQGFYQTWDPQPPQDWLYARRQWGRFVRHVLDQEEPGLDSELQIANACDRGELESEGTREAWRDIKKTFKINSKPVWLDDTVLSKIVHRVKGPTIVWVENTTMGEQLSKRLGCNYYHRRGETSQGESILDADPKHSIVASMNAVDEGYNLQAWNHNLLTVPPDGVKCEQIIGRTHRVGQQADTVYVDIVLGHPAMWGHFCEAYESACFVQNTMHKPQKLLMADLTRRPPRTP